ncbi:MAG: T9SS type A sorting domain-containing protein [Bacteroidales bacterium]|nr:T9SS type A sorting domain-containing protein [Bacteroidales bacterium]
MKSSSFPGMLNVGVQAYTMDGNPNVNQGYPIFGDMVYAVATQNATNVGVTRATLHGNYVGGADTVGFQYRENTTGSTWNTVYATVGSPVSYLLTGLQSNTGYVFRFMVLNNGGVYYGEEKTFTTGTCNLTASVSPSSVTICQGETTTVTASGQSSLGNQFSYSWNTGETTATISVFGGGERIVTVSDSNGCTATASVNVTVNPLPAVAISGNTTLCVGESSLLTASGGSSYVWNTGASTPSIKVSNGGTYSVTASNSYGCSSSASVQVISLENVSISGNLNICQGQSTTLYANGTGSYLWNTGATTSSVTVTQAGLYTVTVSLGNCSSSASVLVSIAANPVPTISGNTTICQGETSLLIANGGNSYVWSNGSASNSIGVSQSGTYSVTATSIEGCTGSTSTYVTVNPLPNVSISGNNSFCQGGSVSLMASGASSYSWSNGSNNATITVSNPGTYTVIGTNAAGCSATASKTVTVNPSYNIPLSESICQGETYNFNGQYLTAAGTYTQNLSTVNGCDSIITLTLTVKALPTPTISGNTVICQGQNTTLTANGGTSYVWSNASTNSSITVNQSGVYTVTVTNAEGCFNTANVTVTVNPLPNVNITGNSSFCQGDNVTLTATGASTYAWSNNSTNASITVSNAGNYTVTGTDGNGCSNTATKAVSVNPTYNTPLTHSMCEGESYNFYGQNITTAGTYTHTLQTVNGCDSVLTLTVTLKALPPTAITGNTTICDGQTTTLTATGGISYAWSNGGTNGSVTVSQSGIYTVTATNAEGCSATANVTVTVNPLPTVVVGGNSTICEGGSTTLTASGADSYSWSTGDNTASVSINAFGVYTVTGTSTEGCSNTANVTVLVSQAPQITISGETDLCAGESTTLTANGGETYLWSNGSTDNTLIVSTTGTWQVIGYNAAGCSSMASATVSVWQPAASEFTVSCPDSCYTWNGTEYCASGDYAQTLQTVHGCDSVVTLHLTITVGIDDHDLAGSVKVFPNPANAMLNVQCSMGDEAATIELLDVTGKLLRTISATGETTSINVSDLADGMYFVRVTTEAGMVTKPFVVKR